MSSRFTEFDAPVASRDRSMAACWPTNLEVAG